MITKGVMMKPIILLFILAVFLTFALDAFAYVDDPPPRPTPPISPISPVSPIYFPVVVK